MQETSPPRLSWCVSSSAASASENFQRATQFRAVDFRPEGAVPTLEKLIHCSNCQWVELLPRTWMEADGEIGRPLGRQIDGRAWRYYWSRWMISTKDSLMPGHSCDMASR